jgi:death on curing protein
MITLELVLAFHDKIIKHSGGAKGLRDAEQLMSAILRPFASAFGEDVHQTHAAKAAALLESIVINHPMLDGNKRLGISMMLFLLAKQKLQVTATEDELYDLTIAVATGAARNAAIVAWLEPRLVPLQA